MVTDQRGEIDPFTDGGIFAIDTRFVSTYKITVNRQPWQLVNSSRISFYAARIHLTNPPIHTAEADIPANALSLTIERTVGEGIHEDFYLANYSGKRVHVVIELTLHSDFADIFEVRSSASSSAASSAPSGMRIGANFAPPTPTRTSTAPCCTNSSTARRRR